MQNFKTKKSLGQNFLQDQNVINRILDTANLSSNDNVLEIGPGQGALTDIVVRDAKKVLAVELDDRLIPVLQEKYGDMDNFKLLHKDFLDVTDEDLDFLRENGGDVKMIANLPYYLTTPIIVKSILDLSGIDELYLMVQKEVAERFTSPFRKKSYGSISVFLQSIANVQYEFTVKKTVFKPVPKVDSAIISLRKKNSPFTPEELPIYEEFLKKSFKQKRKTLVNNLSVGYGIAKPDIQEFLSELGYGKMIRPEEITVSEYIELFKNWKKFMEEKNVQ